MPHTGDLYLKVRLLDEPALWCWEIADRRSGRVVLSGWEATWTAYQSRAEATKAGIEQLRRYLSGRGAGDAAAPPARHDRVARAG
jgi:hypothetical protein